MTAGDSIEGTVLGTPAYMSPEQARGQEVDRRTDVWSLGSILYEALTGRRAFQGRTGTDVLAAVLEREPDWSALPASTPPAVRSLLRRCLQRDRDRRMHDMADVRIELDEALESSREVAAETEIRRRHTVSATVVQVAALLVLLVAAVVDLALRSRLAAPLADIYHDYALAMYVPLPAAISRWLWRALPGFALAFGLLWVGLKIAGRTFPARARHALLPAAAAFAVFGVGSALWLVAQNGVNLVVAFHVGRKAFLVERDLATLHLAAGEPALAIALMDPQGRRDVSTMVWDAPGKAFQLAEAYRAAGDIAAARRLYRRAQEAATAFDEDLSQRPFSDAVAGAVGQLRWQMPTIIESWAPQTRHLRKLPDLVRAVAQQRLEQLGRDEPAGGRPLTPR